MTKIVFFNFYRFKVIKEKITGESEQTFCTQIRSNFLNKLLTT